MLHLFPSWQVWGRNPRKGFVGFLGDLKTPKGHFKINWLLVKSNYFKKQCSSSSFLLTWSRYTSPKWPWSLSRLISCLTWMELGCQVLFGCFWRVYILLVSKVISVQESFAQFFANCRKNENKNDQKAKSIDKRVWCSLFHSFMRLARFQILMFELQGIWQKLLVLS